MAGAPIKSSGGGVAGKIPSKKKHPNIVGRTKGMGPSTGPGGGKAKRGKAGGKFAYGGSGAPLA